MYQNSDFVLLKKKSIFFVYFSLKPEKKVKTLILLRKNPKL